jgi:hypothetical protein
MVEAIRLAINYNWGGSAEGDTEQVNAFNNNFRPQNKPLPKHLQSWMEKSPKFLPGQSTTRQEPTSQSKSTNSERRVEII